MRVAILCGGFGTRLREETEVRPKPMVEIGGRPILWHIMRGYAARGFTEFVLALGYKSDVIKRYFLDYYRLQSHLTVALGSGAVEAHDGERQDWTVHLVDTGLGTQTGGRVKRLGEWLRGGTFMLTYGDGVSDIDLPALLEFHRRCGRLATVSAVRPPSRFGGLLLGPDGEATFTEKPQIGEGWINGGFMVLEPDVLRYIAGDRTSFEADVLEQLSDEGRLAAYPHSGFWQCMDTMRDVRQLRSLWDAGSAPWITWT